MNTVRQCQTAKKWLAVFPRDNASLINSLSTATFGRSIPEAYQEFQIWVDEEPIKSRSTVLRYWIGPTCSVWVSGSWNSITKQACSTQQETWQSDHLPLFWGQPICNTFWGLLILYLKERHPHQPMYRRRYCIPTKGRKAIKCNRKVLRKQNWFK